MKIIMKLFLILFLLITTIFISYILLFSLTLKTGIIVGIILVSLCFILFCITIFGLVIGNLKFLLLHSRLEVLSLMVFSVFLSLFIGILTFLNATVEYAYRDADLELVLDNKTRLAASKIFQIPSQTNLVKDQRGIITYFYSPKYEEIANDFDTFLIEQDSSFHDFFGDNSLDPLTIEIYDNLDTLHTNSLLDDISGYYNKFNQTIHLFGLDPTWESTLLHEYTHYRIHQLAKENSLAAVNRLPIWFEEGLAVVMGYGIKNFHHGDLTEVMISDFHLLDFNEDFHQARHENLDPYRQSYFAVQHIINDYEINDVNELLLSKTMKRFYENLEKITNKSLEEFQQSLLDDLVVNQQLIDDKFVLANEAIKANDYEKAKTLLIDIKKTGYDRDASIASRQLLNLFIEQELFIDAIAQLEELVINEDYGFKTTDLIQLATIYLLVDTEKALATIELAKDEVPANHWIEPKIDEYIEAYRLINSDTPILGYRLLFDKELILPVKLRNNLYRKLVVEYPDEFKLKN